MSVPSDPGWKSPKVLIIFAMIFVCGLACGAAGWALYMDSKLVRPTPVMTLERLQQELKLTPDQRKTVDYQLDEYAKYYQNIEEERHSTAELGKQNILKVLTPEQQKRFLQIFEFPTAVPCEGGAPARR